MIVNFFFHLFVKCAVQAMHMKTLMISKKMFVFWITFNSINLQNKMMMTLAEISINSDVDDNVNSDFSWIIIIMNSIAIAQFFKIIYEEIFEHLLVARFLEKNLLDSISIYFDIIKINNHDMLHLHCLIWLRKISHIFNLRNRLLADFVYIDQVIQFLNEVIKCSIASSI